jgi:hypothetical protein
MSKFEWIPFNSWNPDFPTSICFRRSFFVEIFRWTEDLQNALIEAETCMSRAKLLCVEAAKGNWFLWWILGKP